MLIEPFILRRNKTDVLTEVFKSKMILVGSPTVNNGYLHSIAGILEMIKGMKVLMMNHFQKIVLIVKNILN